MQWKVVPSLDYFHLRLDGRHNDELLARAGMKRNEMVHCHGARERGPNFTQLWASDEEFLPLSPNKGSLSLI